MEAYIVTHEMNIRIYNFNNYDFMIVNSTF